MGYHPRQNRSDKAELLTSRTRNSELWFANNNPVERAMLSYTAKYADKHKVELFAFGIEGSHTHHVVRFPLGNRSDFKRDVNSCTARAVARLTPNYPGGPLLQRRYSNELIGDNAAIEREFFYTVLQPVKDGLVSKISEYPGYNCFHDAIWGIKREMPVVDWTAFGAAKRRRPDADIRDFIRVHILEYQRLPGYEHLTQHEYATLMMKKLEEYRQEILRDRAAKGKFHFLGREKLLQVVPGTPAKNPKRSDQNSHRPRTICSEPGVKQIEEDYYWQNYLQYKEASQRYRNGELNIEFPIGMNKPYLRNTSPTPPT